MPAQIIDGAAHAAVLRQQVGAQVQRLRASAGVTPGLAVVLVGSDPASFVLGQMPEFRRVFLSLRVVVLKLLSYAKFPARTGGFCEGQ